MRPVDHMKPSEDELIAHIKGSLATYEESYVPGAWEKFSEKERKKPGLILWIGRLSSAAAVLIIGLSLFWFASRAPEPNSVKLSPAQGHEIVKANPGENKAVPAIEKVYLEATVTKENAAIAYLEIPDTLVPQPIAEETVVVAQIPATEQKQPAEPKVASIEAFLQEESDKSNADKAIQTPAEKDNRWAVGVVVSPSIGNAGKLNMGYGISMGYALSDKVSLNSGISYSEMAASRSMDRVVAGVNAIAGEKKSLESIEQTVTGIDIPLDIRYNLSKNIYANVGVSAFAVIDQQRNNNYIQERLVQRSSDDVAGGNEFKSLIVNEKVTENVPESEIGNNRYIGFYNFSFGYKQKVAKDKSLSIEPFMKVPMKEVTKDNLRLMGTGIKLKFDF